MYKNTPCKDIVKVASNFYMSDSIHQFKGQSYDDLVQYKGEQICQTISPDININGNSVDVLGCFL